MAHKEFGTTEFQNLSHYTGATRQWTGKLPER